MTTELQAAIDRLLASRVEQGLPARCTDPAALTVIAEAIRPVLTETPTPSRKRRGAVLVAAEATG